MRWFTKLTRKVCSVCEEEKELSEFYSYKKYSKSRGEYTYHHPNCKKCAIEKQLKRQNSNSGWVEYISEYQKEYYQRKDVKEREKEKSRRRRDSGELKEWQRKNMKKLSKYNQERSKRKQHVISIKEWKNCKEYFDYRCAYCGISEKEHREIHRQQLHREHVVHDGSNDLSNCVPACKPCNSSKYEARLEDWYNEENESFTIERLNKIHQWLSSDYKKYKE